MEKINEIGGSLSKIKKSHLLVFFAMVGITILFLTLLMAYSFSKPTWTWKQFSFPKVFLISTFVLVASSYTANKSISYFKKDEVIKFSKYIKYTLYLGLGFVFLQIIGWFQLTQQGIYLAGKPDGSYLYIISALHALHLIVGVSILTYIYFKTRGLISDPVKKLMYFSDKNELNFLQLSTVYWHFVDILWIVLLLFFLWNHL